MKGEYYLKKKIAIIAVVIVAIITSFLVAVYGGGLLQRMTADFRGETSQIEQTQADADYRIGAYDQFYDKCSGVQSIESKIVNLTDELEAVEDEKRKSVLNTSITASKNKRAEMINDYNADARKEATRGQFRASDLPYELSEEEEETVCES